MASHDEWLHIFTQLKITIFGKSAHKFVIPGVLWVVHILGIPNNPVTNCDTLLIHTFYVVKLLSAFILTKALNLAYAPSDDSDFLKLLSYIGYKRKEEPDEEWG